MNEIKKGDVVGRKSYGKDIFFIVKNILVLPTKKIAILVSLTERIEADSEIEDLEKIPKEEVKKYIINFENKIKNEDVKNKARTKVRTGRILHLDGDKKYSEKSYQYYRRLKLDAIVKNIPEYKQPKVVYGLLKIYNPDILVITGHDGMIKRGRDYYDIYNYRNSKYFVETVREARRYDEKYNKNLVIIAGACQSYFEAIISAGANFASSPARILIDFLDPLVVAKKIALTDKYQYITINDIEQELRDGKNGISGIGAKGKMTNM